MNDLNTSISNCKIQGNIVYLPNPNEFKMENYPDVRKAFLNAGAKYKNNTFIFPSDPQPYIDRITGGEKVNIKKEFQFYGTSDILGDEMVVRADIKPHHIVGEPEAGAGALVKAIQRAHPGMWVNMFELMDINREILKTIPNTRLLGNDFLTESQAKSFDRIVANPPFNKNQDIDHIYRMWECLKDNGRIVTIASKHWQFSKNKKESQFRIWLDNVGAVVEDVEAGAFEESGTKIATCMITIDK